jgi:hypothetical protein
MYGLGTRSYNRSVEKHDMDAERKRVTKTYLAGPRPVIELGPEWLVCRCDMTDQPHMAHAMGRYDFDYGFNVKQDDVPTYQQEPPTAANDRDGDQQLGEQDDMIPRGTPSNDQPNQRGKRKGSGLRYLSADMLSNTHQAATINDARVENDTFRQGTVVTVKLKFKGEFILWTLRPGNPNLDTLGDALGDDETTWKGKDIELFIEEDSFNGKKWIRSEVVVTTPPAKPRR